MSGTIGIGGMVCDICVKSATKVLSDVPGITNVSVDLDKGQAIFDEEHPIDPDEVRAAVERTGYKLAPNNS
jgi:copper chaperone